MELLSNPSGFPKVIQTISEHLSTSELKSLSVVSGDWSQAIKDVLEERAYFNLKCTDCAESINRSYRKFLLSKVNRIYVKKAVKLLVKYIGIQWDISRDYQCEELVLRKIKLSNSSLKLLRDVRKLSTLEIETCSIPANLDEMSFDWNLKSFTIISDDSVNKDFIHRVLMSNKDSLRSIHLMIPFDDFSEMFESTIFPELEKLSFLSNTVSADALEKFFKHHKSLINFTNINAVGLQDSTLDSLSRNCTKLEVLDIQCPLNATERSVSYINRFRELRVLNIKSFCLEGRDLSEIHQPKLEEFSFGVFAKSSNSITSKDFESLFSSMPEIRKLRLSHCENEETRLTSKVVSLVPRYLPHLKDLMLDANYYLCEGEIEQIDPFRNLESLNLYNTNLQDKFLCAIEAPRLKKIDIGLSNHVTVKGLMYMVDHFRELESIEMTSCQAITDSAIKLLLDHLKFLKFIDARDCPLSLDGIKYILGESFVNANLSYHGDIAKLLRVCGATGFIFITKHDKSILKVSNRCREVFIHIK